MTSDDLPPLYRPKATAEPSVFRVEALLREARRQRRLPEQLVPQVCLLDPDGDVVRHLARSGHAIRLEAWACYHSELWLTARGGLQIGVVPCAVGAPYAVLVAEELHASGCNLVISVTSAGRILPIGDPPCFLLIERAWRDEGTSLHYLPPSEWAELRPELSQRLAGRFDELGEPLLRGASWTTDAPFRETAQAIAAAQAAGVHAVEITGIAAGQGTGPGRRSWTGCGLAPTRRRAGHGRSRRMRRSSGRTSMRPGRGMRRRQMLSRHGISASTSASSHSARHVDSSRTWNVKICASSRMSQLAGLS